MTVTWSSGDPGDASTEAVADHRNRHGLADVLDRSGDVEHGGAEGDRHRQLDPSGHAGVVVAEFDAVMPSGCTS